MLKEQTLPLLATSQNDDSPEVSKYLTPLASFKAADRVDRKIQISIDPVQKFYPIGPCPNCTANLWAKDWEFEIKTYHRYQRFYCFYCGQDFYPDIVIKRELDFKGDQKDA